MGHGHSHAPLRKASQRALAIALAITVAFGIAQVVAGFAFDSLALLADSVHNISDGLAIGLAAVAAWAAARPPSGRRTYGWQRLEIIAALANGLALVALGGWIIWEAVVRLRNPQDVRAGGVLAFGLIGAGANAVAAIVLARGSDRRDLNVQGALRHTLADVAGSLGVALGALVILVTGWERADAVVGIVIGLVVLGSSWELIRRPLEILLEAAPAEVDMQEIGTALAGVRGVRSVHDLHVWTITSGLVALSAHVVARDRADHDEVLHGIQALLRERFEIEHVTIQIDRDHAQGLLPIHRRDCPEGPAAAVAAGGTAHHHRHDT